MSEGVRADFSWSHPEWGHDGGNQCPHPRWCPQTRCPQGDWSLNNPAPRTEQNDSEAVIMALKDVELRALKSQDRPTQRGSPRHHRRNARPVCRASADADGTPASLWRDKAKLFFSAASSSPACRWASISASMFPAVAIAGKEAPEPKRKLRAPDWMYGSSNLETCPLLASATTVIGIEESPQDEYLASLGLRLARSQFCARGLDSTLSRCGNQP